MVATRLKAHIMKRSTRRLCMIAVLGIAGVLGVDRVSTADWFSGWGWGGYAPYYGGYYGAYYSPWYSAYYAPGFAYYGGCSSGCCSYGCGSCGGCFSGCGSGCGWGCGSSCGCGWGGSLCGGCSSGCCSGGCGYSLCDLGCCGGCGSGCSTCSGAGCASGTPGAGCGTTTAPPAGAAPEGFVPRPSPPYEQQPPAGRPRSSPPTAGQPGAQLDGDGENSSPPGTQYKRGKGSDDRGAGEARTFEAPATGSSKGSGGSPAGKSDGNDQGTFEAKKPLTTIRQHQSKEKAPLPRIEDDSAGQPSKPAHAGQKSGSVPPAASDDGSQSFALTRADRLFRVNPALNLQERPTWHQSASPPPIGFPLTAAEPVPERLSPSPNAPNWALLPADAAVARD
jgi:hypothetical protein